MRDWRESVEANILTTGLVRIASEISAFVSIDRSTNNSDDERPEGEKEEEPGVTQRSTVVKGFDDYTFNGSPNHFN